MSDNRSLTAPINADFGLRMEFTDTPPTRKCGGCVLCCKLLPIKREDPRQIGRVVNEMIGAGLATPEQFANMMPDWHKPAGKPCEHQRHGKGCAVYARRPFGCRTWSCEWLLGNDTADVRRPDRTHYVIDSMPDMIRITFPDQPPRDIVVVNVWCDPSYPDAYKDPALRAFIFRRAAEGKATMIRYDESRAFTIFAGALHPTGGWHEERRGQLAHRECHDLNPDHWTYPEPAPLAELAQAVANDTGQPVTVQVLKKETNE